MKIYTTLVMDMSGKILHEESYDHEGPVALMKGSDNEVEETSQEIALARISREQWNEYNTRLKPFEDEWIENTAMDAGDHAKMTGQVNAAVGSEFDKQQAVGEKQMFQAGMDPSSGAYKAMVSGVNADRGVAQGKAQSVASQAVDDQTYQGLQQSVNLGRGQAVEAGRDMTSLAYDATGKAISDTINKRDTTQSWVSSGMSAAGMGLAGWNNRTPKEEIFNASGYGPSR
jgi:hypothetical protein